MSDAVDVSTNPAADAPQDLAPSSPEDATRPVEQAGGEVGVNEDKQKDEKKLNALQLFAKSAQERKAARLAGAQGEKDAGRGKAEAKPEKADKPADAKDAARPKADAKDATEAPERDANGRFVPKDKPADAKPDEKAAAGKDKPKDAPADKGKEEPPPAAAKPAEAKPEPPKEEPKPKADSAEQRRIAELLLEKKRWDAERLEHKRNSERSAAETKAKLDRLEQLEKLIERARGDELDDDVLEPLIGRGFVKLVKDVNAGKEKGGIAYKARPQLPPELQPLAKTLEEKVSKFEAWEREKAERERVERETRERTEREAKRKAADAADAEKCKSWLSDKSEKYPYLTALPDAATQFRDTLYAAMRNEKGELVGPEPDPDDIAEMIEQSLTDKLGTIFSSEYALKRALRDPKTRELVSRLLNAASDAAQTQEPSSPQRDSKGDQETTGSGKGPPTLSSKVTQEAPVASEPPDEFEDPDGYKAWWRANFRQGNRKRSAAMDEIRSRNTQAAE
ncbi:MAG TPA: hypothetical protein VEL28_01645 [Candidatus Binatia bacterium]|nr:hypothetical protein [Candidatus Binatia bacterium]